MPLSPDIKAFDVEYVSTFGVFCFPPNTPVPLLNEFKCIKDITVGDSLLSPFGQTTVLKTFKRHYSGNLITIRVSGLPAVQVTPDHPFLVYSNNQLIWKKAKDLKLHDRCVFKIPLSKELPQTINVSQWLKCEGDCHIGRCLSSLHADYHNVIASQDLDKDFAYVLGWYFAEGNCEDHYFHLTVNRHTDPISRICKSIVRCGFNYKVKPVGYTVARITVYNSQLTKFLKQFGKGKTKIIPSEVFASSTDIKKSFLQGYFEGDGRYRNHYHSQQISTASFNMVHNLFILCLQVGFKPYFTYEDRITQFSKGKIHRLFDIGWTDSRYRRAKNQTTSRDGFYLFPIKKLSQQFYNGYVYNIQTTTESYYSSFLGVHNCGIASYTHNLGSSIHRHGKRVFVAGKQPDGSHLEPPKELTATRTWSNHNYQFPVLSDVVHFQHEYGLFPDNELFISRLCELDQLGIKTLVTFHSVVADHRDFYDQVSKFATIIVHQDMAKAIIPDAHVVPHGAYFPREPVPSKEECKKLLGYEGKRLVLMHGFFSPDKRYDMGINAVRYVKSLLPDVEVAVVAGRHPLADETAITYMKQYARVLYALAPKPHSRFVFKRLQEPELDIWLRAADILLYPYHGQSIYSISGNVMRGLWSETPIVSSKSIRLSQVWHGVYESQHKAKDFAEAIYNLLSDHTLYSKYAQKSKEIADQFKWSKIARLYDPLYQ